MEQNNSDFGLSLQKHICVTYEIKKIPGYAIKEFNANYNNSYESELEMIRKKIFDTLRVKPVECLTYKKEIINDREHNSLHNFLLKNDKTLSIRTTKTSDKVAPRVLGQAGYQVLNDFFGDVYGAAIETQEDIKRLMYYHIHEILPDFIEHLFLSDYTVIVPQRDVNRMLIVKADDLVNYTFERNDFQFTRDLNAWTESTTLKYHNTSIAEIQVHKERTFKFRFIISNIPTWFQIFRETNETFGMSAEAAICDFFNLKKPYSFKNRVKSTYVAALQPVIEQAFKNLPAAVKHTGSETGSRGGASKCSYDFILKGNKTLSLKTNKGKMVCPPEVGQPGAETCLLYFKHLFPANTREVTQEKFKQMVYDKIEKLIPIYIEHLFDSDWLLWIYEEADSYSFKVISQNQIKEKNWEKGKFTFTKEKLEDWNESNTVKYDGLSIGEFQVHKNRSCFKFRFNLQNLLQIILI
ncbi:MAG: hypothetical protein VZQ47_01220 [Treponema sp.]|nr:hypothetical protein [Treponema sp.]MEE3434163.1 hypothetical protein [Treponema sp.]